MEPPTPRSGSSRRAFAVDGQLAVRLALLPGLLLSVLLGASCERPSGRDGAAEASRGLGSATVDAAWVAAGEEGTFDDLPGVAAFEELRAELRSVALARANRTRCDCGCPSHSVNHCLHQEEACEVALRLARSFVDDALSLQVQTEGQAPAVAPDPSEMEPAEPDGSERPADGTSH